MHAQIKKSHTHNKHTYMRVRTRTWITAALESAARDAAARVAIPLPLALLKTRLLLLAACAAIRPSPWAQPVLCCGMQRGPRSMQVGIGASPRAGGSSNGRASRVWNLDVPPSKAWAQQQIRVPQKLPHAGPDRSRSRHGARLRVAQQLGRSDTAGVAWYCLG